ncbi:Gar1/Naf1 RNA binding region-domain-containing protein [Xylariomycetidae sp. FL0641]|nr:Gar1/Naf1 RNA binding region-domain-containing protein [Xylariomycetidae sp. FL0641]
MASGFHIPGLTTLSGSAQTNQAKPADQHATTTTTGGLTASGEASSYRPWTLDSGETKDSYNASEENETEQAKVTGQMPVSETGNIEVAPPLAHTETTKETQLEKSGISDAMDTSETVEVAKSNLPEPLETAEVSQTANAVAPAANTELGTSKQLHLEQSRTADSMEVDQPQASETQNGADVSLHDAPPSPPSLTSGLEALLGGLDPEPAPTSSSAQHTSNETGQNGHTQGPEQQAEGEEEHPEWEEDSSPYESSSDSSDDSDDSDESDDDQNYAAMGIEETARMLMEAEGGSDDEGDGKARGKESGGTLRTKNELPEEVIPKPDVTITPEMEIVELGTVEHIVEGNTIVVKANTTGEYQVVDIGSVLCLEDRTVVAAVADVIASVIRPFYTARFTNEDEINALGLHPGTKVFYPPAHAVFGFTQALRGDKGTDASNWHDEEVGEDEVEFSDDEKEAEYKRMKKGKKRGGRDGRDGNGNRGGRTETSSAAPPSELKYDDDDDDEGPYKKLTRPVGFGQGQAPAADSYHSRYQSNASGPRGGRGDFRGRGGRGRFGRGNRGGSRGGYSLPPRPQQGGNDYQQQPAAPQHQQYPPGQQTVPQFGNQAYPPPPQSFNPATAQQQNGTAQFPFAWPQNFMPGMVPPPPPPFGGQGQQGAAGTYYNPAFFAAIQQHMQAQQNQQGQQSQPGQQGPSQNGQWSGHGGHG